MIYVVANMGCIVSLSSPHQHLPISRFGASAGFIHDGLVITMTLEIKLAVACVYPTSSSTS